jgi:hypothetical protein
LPLTLTTGENSNGSFEEITSGDYKRAHNRSKSSFRVSPQEPTRAIWVFYEWLTGDRLDLKDATVCRYLPVVDPALQFASERENASRYHIESNLPGTPEFCPLVTRTKQLGHYIKAFRENLNHRLS